MTQNSHRHINLNFKYLENCSRMLSQNYDAIDYFLKKILCMEGTNRARGENVKCQLFALIYCH